MRLLSMNMRKTPIILITRNKKTAIGYRNQGIIYDFISKPIRRNRLFRKVINSLMVKISSGRVLPYRSA